MSAPSNDSVVDDAIPPTVVPKSEDDRDDYRALMPLFHRLIDKSTTESERSRIRERLITGHLPVAEHIARKFRNRGQREEDLRQVATVGLINAVDRFDPTRGTDFLSFAVPTITGEVRRHFRDTTWSVHVPRRLKELHTSISAAATRLSQNLGRSPRPREIAAELGLDINEVFEGLQAGFAYRSDSLDGGSDDGETVRFERQFGHLDRQMALVEDRETIAQALTTLPDREASIVVMRFFGNMTQTQIANRLGMSQMHVSRLLSSSMEILRTALTASSGPNDK